VLSPALFFLAQAGLVAVAPENVPGCPSAKQVEDALYARVPGAVVPFSEAERRGALQLTLAAASPDGGRSFLLVDAGGEIRLQRALSPATAQRDCAALAETAALIVQRYLTDLDDPTEALPPDRPLEIIARQPAGPDRRWDLSVASGWRVGSEVWGALALGGRVGRLLGSRGRLLLAGSAGVTGAAELEPTGTTFRGSARARQFPAELGLWWRTLGSWAELQVGAGAGLDLTRVHTRSASGLSDARLLLGPTVFAATALRLALRGPTFFRLSAGAAASLVTYRLSQRSESSVDSLTIFSVPTHRFYARIAADIGFFLR
jgi:hypothetical protein